MGLDEYNRKRDFARTAEPPGREGRTASGHMFVIQKHDATRLHYDFRLEMDGLLKSWSVPKGPSLDPTVKRLAVMTEDHPVEYGDFEGVIPAKEYGGGTVALWDRGEWVPIGDPGQGLAAGNLKFELRGQKLSGKWALIKLKPRRGRVGRNDDERSWLLIKERDKFVRPEAEYDVVEARPESVTTGRELGEIAAAGDRVWHSAKPPDASGVPGVRKVGRWKTPALAVPTRARSVPTGDDWVHELEVAGTRVRGEISNGDARLVDGAGRDRTAAWDALAKGLLQLPARIAVLDGIATKLGADGRGHAADRPDTLYLLDLMRLDDWDLLRVPLTERKPLLERLVAGGARGGVVRYADHVRGHGEEILREAGRLGARAIVSKRADAPYRPGPRPTKDWRVIACAQTKDGATGARQDEEAPVVHGARERAGGKSKAAAHEHAAATAGASVRQPRRPGEEVVAGVRLTHPERPLFPNAGVTKRDLAAYYETIGPTMLPFVRDRPLTLVRGPQGAGGETFFVKNAGPWAPRELRRVSLHRDREAAPGEPSQAMVIDDIPGLVAMAQMDVLEVHIGNARAARIDKPDQVVFDLDPGPESTFAEVAEGALRVRDVLSAIELVSFVKTTGSKGLHVVVPLVPDGGWTSCSRSRARWPTPSRATNRAATPWAWRRKGERTSCSSTICATGAGRRRWRRFRRARTRTLPSPCQSRGRTYSQRRANERGCGPTTSMSPMARRWRGGGAIPGPGSATRASDWASNASKRSSRRCA